MRAIQHDSFGGPEVLGLTDLPLPVPGPGQIRVKMAATGVNFSDTLMRADAYAVTPALPSVPGYEVAGHVTALGPDLHSGAPTLGDRVAAPLFAGGQLTGGYAEEVLIDARLAVPVPDALPLAQAAAVMVQGLTALWLLRVSPVAGKRVLVNAAAGGVGALLVQLAKHDGAEFVVGAASSAAKLAFIDSLGVDASVNYTESGWADRMAARGAPQVIFEATGGKVTEDSLGLLDDRGEITIYGALNVRDFDLGPKELKRMIFRNQSLRGFALVPLLTPANLQADLAMLFDLVATGALKVHVAAELPLAEAAEAHRRLEGRGVTGKLVLTA